MAVLVLGLLHGQLLLLLLLLMGDYRDAHSAGATAPHHRHGRGHCCHGIGGAGDERLTQMRSGGAVMGVTIVGGRNLDCSCRRRMMVVELLDDGARGHDHIFGRSIGVGGGWQRRDAIHYYQVLEINAYPVAIVDDIVSDVNNAS